MGCTIAGNTTRDNLGNVGISFLYATSPPIGCAIGGNTLDSSYWIYSGAAVTNRIYVSHDLSHR
jgi:hypothetical protein